MVVWPIHCVWFYSNVTSIVAKDGILDHNKIHPKTPSNQRGSSIRMLLRKKLFVNRIGLDNGNGVLKRDSSIN